MRIQGRLGDVQSDLDFYIRLTSTSSHRTVEDLRSFYYSRFLDDARLGLRSIIDSKKATEKEEKQEAFKNESIMREDYSASVEVTGSFGASSFLAAVGSIRGSNEEVNTDESSNDAVDSLIEATSGGIEPVRGICLDDIASSGGYGSVDIRGTILDDVIVSGVIDTGEAMYETSDHGTFLEDYVNFDMAVASARLEAASFAISAHGTFLEDFVVEIPEGKVAGQGVVEEDVVAVEEGTVVLEDIHGIILEDYVPEVVEKIQNERVGGAVEKSDFTEDVSPSESDFNDLGTEKISDEVFTDDGSLDDGFFEDYQKDEEVEKGNSNVIPIREGIDTTPVVLPPTVREYLKKHLGSSVSDVEKYYSRKIIEKEIKMGKIYKKGNRLYI